jgi:hypothetical protein
VAPVPQPDRGNAEEQGQGVIELGLSDFNLHIKQDYDGFQYFVFFHLSHTNRNYSTAGKELTPEQCTASVMSYIAQVVREAVAE